MKTKLTILFLFIFIIGLSAVQATEYPKIEKYVNDFANLLDEQQEFQLNTLAKEIETNTTVQIAIVTVSSTNGEDKVLYANHLGDKNGVGQADTDNGVVVLWSIDNVKGGAIATGRGIESTLTDATVTRIGKENRNLFDEGKYYNGFLNIVTQLNEVINKDKEPVTTNPKPLSTQDNSVVLIIGIIFFFVIILPIIIGSSGLESSPSYTSSYSGKRYRKSRSKAGAYVATSVASTAWTSDDDDDDSSGGSGGSGSFGGGWGGGGFGGGGGGF